MAEDGYKDIPEEDRKKAKVFFDRGKTVADTGNYEYAIEMYLNGIRIDPEDSEAHKALREISLKRKASGGKDLGMFEKMKLKRPTKDDKENVLNAEKMLAYSPGDTESMLLLLQNAHRAGYYDTVMWIGPILQKANADTPKPEYNKFILLRDVYVSLATVSGMPELWKRASDACHYAALMRPNDMDLQTELKNLGAQHTMSQGNYSKGGSFRDSVRNLRKQEDLLADDRGVSDLEVMGRVVKSAEEEYRADPSDQSRMLKLVDAYEKTENSDFENKGVELLTKWFEKTQQFRFRQRVGLIQMKQLMRMERAKRASLQKALLANPNDEEAKKEYADFRNEQMEFELSEYKLASENYPTDSGFRYNMGLRLFALRRFDDAIPVFQQVRNDPKFRVDATIHLAQCFFNSGYVDETDETLAGLIAEYKVPGDLKSKLMYYWRARALEQKGQIPDSIKLYSQIAQWDFNFQDVQARVKRLRAGGAGTPT